MAVLADVVHSRASCSRKTQASISTARIGTQCALRFVISAGSQTEAEFPESGIGNLQRGASFKTFPTSQVGLDSADDGTEVQHQNYNSPCCPQSSNTRKTVNNHERLHISGELHAGQSYQQPKHQETNLIVHEKGKATVMPNTCSVCTKQYIHKRHLQDHMKLHISNSPYICSICEKSFTRGSLLKSHMKVHTGEKPYACSICEKKFSQKAHLVKHERLHTGEKPYICSICQKGFTQKGHLVNHERLHTGEKPYICGICQKMFTQKAHLVKHKRVHTGEKPFICSICLKSFSNKQNLTKHERLHTQENSHV